MDFGFLYGSPKGRISRKTWWLGSIGLAVISFVVSIVLALFGAVLGVAQSASGLGFLALVSALIFAWPYYALTAKRLNDRSRPWTLFFVFYLPSLVQAVLMMLGVSGTMEMVQIFGQEAPRFAPNALGKGLNIVAAGVAIWALIELGFMRGDEGPNAHGPDPLA